MIAFSRSFSRPLRQASTALVAGVLVLALQAIVPAHAQDAKNAPAAAKPAPDTVIAKVNGAEIRQSDLDMAEQEAAASPEIEQMDPASRHEAVLGSLINMKLVTKAAEDRKMGDTPEFKRKLAFVRDRLMMDEVLSAEAKTAVTDKALHAVYDDAAKQMSGDIEVHARHILVDSEDEAKKIADQARKGADFSDLAKKNSKDPGAADGGDLGFFTKDQMVPEFSEAAFKLEPGQISDPVKTQFGWHVIKVEEKRPRKAPDFDQVKSQLESFVVRKAQADYIDKLRQTAKIERLDQPASAAQPSDAKAPDAKAPDAKASDAPAAATKKK